MQQPQKTGQPVGMTLRRFLFISNALLIILSALLLSSSTVAFRLPGGQPRRRTLSITSAVNGASLLDNDAQTTPPTFDFSPGGSTPVQIEVSPLFAGYYRARSGATGLGAPLTAAFRTTEGWIQFFASGALLLPVAQPKHPQDLEEQPDHLVTLIDAGVRDPGTGILRLPLLQALLRVGSLVPVVAGSSLTYVDLRAAASPAALVPAPHNNGIALYGWARSPGIFVEEGRRAGTAVGHMVPLPIWSYIQRADVSPDGWQTDFGLPLTEALPFTVVRGGVVHHMLVQAFWGDAVVLDESAQNSASGQPIARLENGLAYLSTLGPPPLVIVPGQAAWAQANTTLLDVPWTGQAVAHVGPAFPLALNGDSSWFAGRLWYQVEWTTPHNTFSAWADASALTFTSPGQAPGWASIDALSPDLAASLAGEEGNVGVAVYDVTDQRYYTWDAGDQFITGSSIKVPIMLTLLNLTESQGREPDQSEMGLLTTMIENSNNDSASALYYGEVGGAGGVGGYLQQIGISGVDLDPNAFGWSLISPLAMVNLLTRLEQGAILTAQDRQLALSLMENIESDQQVGVGDTAPQGATVAMKDGWVTGPDGLWTMNSSGIVTLGQQTYIIAVYTQGQSTLEDGQGIAQSVCGAIAALLT